MSDQQTATVATGKDKPGCASVNGSATSKRTRAERKAARRAEWARQEQQAADYRRRHPILSGAIKIVDYVPPKGKWLNSVLGGSRAKAKPSNSDDKTT